MKHLIALCMLLGCGAVAAAQDNATASSGFDDPCIISVYGDTPAQQLSKAPAAQERVVKNSVKERSAGN